MDDFEKALTRAIGRELRLARTNAGWTRPTLLGRMREPLRTNTYGCYEQGIRQCSTPGLVKICDTLEVSVLELLGRALQHLEPDKYGVRLSQHVITGDERTELDQLRQWIALQP